MKHSITTRSLTVLLLAGGAMLVPGPLYAAETEGMPMPRATASAATTSVHGKGVVKSVDAAAGTITLAHEPIAEIDWPAMTMSFKVSGNAEERVEVGETVEFEMTATGSDYTITRIEKSE